VENKNSKNSNSSIVLVAALGNHGFRYETTRHNIAWQMIAFLSFYNELDWKRKFRGKVASISIDERNVFFLEPQTYMNRSGWSLLPMMQFYKIEVEEVLVIHDDLELDFGVLGFKEGGGLAGHNGLRSIEACLETRDFKRMRLGISRPPHSDITSYVLGNFSGDEQAVLPTYLGEAAKLLEMCLKEDFDAMVKNYRKKDILNT
jgi:PTH1 family peptidyl-tRNA hydrolase